MKVNQTQSTELHFILKALGYLKTHWWLIALEVIAIYGYQIYSYKKTDPVFVSGASVLIDTQQRDMATNVLLKRRSHEKTKRNLVHLLTSHAAMKRFAQALEDHYNEEGRPEYLRPFLSSGKAMEPNAYRRFIRLTWNTDSDSYSISCQAGSPEAAQNLCLVYAETIQSYYPEIGQREAMMKREFLARQIAAQSREISERELALMKFQRQYPEFFDYVLEHGGFNTKRDARLEVRNEVRALKKKIRENREMKEFFLSVPRAKRGEYVALQRSLNALNTRLGELRFQRQLVTQSKDPSRAAKMQLLSEEISRVANNLAELNDRTIELVIQNPVASEEIKAQVKKFEVQHRVYLIKLAAAEEEFAEVNEKYRKFQQYSLEHNRLRGELTHRKTLLDNLFQREQETEIELSAGQAEIFRLREPSINPIPIAPVLSKHLYTALSMCLFVIAVTILLLMALVPRLDSEAEVARYNLPVIGKIPVLQIGRKLSEDLPSFAMEYIRIMQYRLQRETKGIECPVIIISSPVSREGKSTVAQLLAIAAQNNTRKTLLIDADILTIKEKTFLGILEDQTPGLRHILTDENYNHQEQIVRTSVEGVSFLPRGSRLDPGETNHSISKPFEGLLVKLRKEYDMIIVDTPPMFASNLSHQFTSTADLIILVSRLYFTRPKDIMEAIQTAKIFSRAPVGVALNCVPLTGPLKRSSNYYFSRKKTPKAA